MGVGGPGAAVQGGEGACLPLMHAPQTTKPPPTHPHMSWLRAAVASSDLLLTVSPHHAHELLSDSTAAAGGGCSSGSSGELGAMAGWGGDGGGGCSGEAVADLHRLLGCSGLRGIMNGVDTEVWDPERDTHLPLQLRYGHDTALHGKAAAKALLQVCACAGGVGWEGRRPINVWL